MPASAPPRAHAICPLDPLAFDCGEAVVDENEAIFEGAEATEDNGETEASHGM